MKSESLQLSGLILLKPSVFSDVRGFFYESYRKERYQQAGIDCEFVQDSVSFSVKHVVRGLHYQQSPGQAKLVTALQGTIWDVAVDIRENSPTFGRWAAVELSETNHYQLFIPIGFAHGFCILSETATVCYKVSAPYDSNTERTLLWNDPAFGIQWPVLQPILSERDLAAEPYHAPLGLVDLDSARQSQIEAKRSDRRGPAPGGQGEKEDRFGEVAASPNSPNLTERGIIESKR